MIWCVRSGVSCSVRETVESDDTRSRLLLYGLSRGRVLLQDLAKVRQIGLANA